MSLNGKNIRENARKNVRKRRNMPKLRSNKPEWKSLKMRMTRMPKEEEFN